MESVHIVIESIIETFLVVIKRLFHRFSIHVYKKGNQKYDDKHSR